MLLCLKGLNKDLEVVEHGFPGVRIEFSMLCNEMGLLSMLSEKQSVDFDTICIL